MSMAAKKTAPKVTVIPPTIRLYSDNAPLSAKRRVAGYARVSTDKDEQQTSYEAQVDYYTQYITSRSDWELIKIYTDEAVSGTSTKHRDGFREMVADALAGKIDLIVTKSVSRFARNTVVFFSYGAFYFGVFSQSSIYKARLDVTFNLALPLLVRKLKISKYYNNIVLQKHL